MILTLHDELNLIYMLFTLESSFHTLLTSFEQLYTNMYLIGLSDGAVSALHTHARNLWGNLCMISYNFFIIYVNNY